MRKWMRERITRRKKDPKEAGKESTQAPLQPAYFDGEPPSPAATTAREESLSEQPRARHPEVAHFEDQPSAPDHSHFASPAPQSDSRESSEKESLTVGGERRVQQQQRPTLDPRKGRRRRGRGGRGRGSRPFRPIGPQETQPSAQIAENDVQNASPAISQDRAGLTAQPVSSPRVPNGVVVLAIGLPGSGKSSWFKRHNITPLSSDLLRALLFDDPTEQRFQDLVFSNLRSMLKARLIARRPMNYVDATNLTSHDRRGWIKLAKDYGYEVRAVFFDVPLEVCLERNRNRDRVVSEDVMRRMAAKQKPPTFEEGFSKITVVRLKQKE
jgi:predicted kinase